jgi:ABC-type transporter Mla maintaining outer membrane lipid asymmetry permease subunit MlaE
MVTSSLIVFVVVAMLLAGAFTLALHNEPQSRDAFIEVFTMQPEIQWWCFTDQVTGGVLIGRILCAG